MALSRLTFIFLLNSIFLIYINCDNDFHENLDEFYRPQIWSLVNYLNANPSRIYNYNYATLINAQNKDIDNTDLTIDVEVECRNLNSNKCVTSLEECKGTIKYNTETANYEVFSASCNPKTRLDLSRNEEASETARYEEEHLEPPVEESGISETYYDGMRTISEAPMRKVTVHLSGAPCELTTDVKRWTTETDTALAHIESEKNNKHVLVKIIRAQREVVNGVKYILLLEIAPTTCPKTEKQSDSCQRLKSKICRVVYFCQTWINQNKNIIVNNCTSSQEFDALQPTMYSGNDQDNEIDRNYHPGKPVGYTDRTETDDRTNYDSIADGNPDDILKMTGGIMDSARMRDLESQIVYLQTEEPVELETTTEEMSGLTDDQKSALDDFMGMMDDEPRFKRSPKNNDDDSSSSSSSSSSEEDNNNDNNNDDNNDDDQEKTKRKTKKYKTQKTDDNNNDNDDDSSSSSSSSEEDNNDDDNGKGKKHKSKKSKREAIPQDDSSASSEENNEDNRARRQAVSSESNETSEEKKDSTTAVAPVAENKISSEESSSEEHRGGVRRKRSLGQTEQLVKVSPEERNYVENLADFSATTLDDIDADNHKRIILQILGAKKNMDGTLYHLTLRVGISKCPEEIEPVIDLQKLNRKDNNCRNKLFENLTKICKVQIRVDDDKTNPKVEKSHCQNIKKEQEDTNINRTGRSKRGGVPGGITTVSTDDEKIVEYAKNILKELDANDGEPDKRKLVTIKSASRQVVSGVLYRIKMEFTEHSTTTICDFEIWDQPWVKPNGKQVTVKCEGQEKKEYRYKRSHHHQEMLGKDDHDVHIGMFKSYMNKYNKNYSNKSEFKKRFKIFRENMKIIKNLNENEQGTAKYGPTIFADLSKDEYKRYLGLKPSLYDSNNIPMPQAKIPDIELKPEFDWRKKGVISEVKNQGACGSCWAFSVTGNIEGMNAIKTGNLIELSEQELVDCDKLDNGCNGGLPDNAYRAIEQLGGLETETDYPYDAEDEKCVFNKTLTKVQISGAVNISSDETDMAKWLTKNGPISIGINANAMQFYMGGVSHPLKFLCNPNNLDHGVLIVGYGVHKYPLFKKTLPFWIVKNSWGTTWGEQGYYRVYRGDGTCGVNKMASSAVL